jgi:hypothetical protein
MCRQIIHCIELTAKYYKQFELRAKNMVWLDRSSIVFLKKESPGDWLGLSLSLDYYFNYTGLGETTMPTIFCVEVVFLLFVRWISEG